MVNPRARHALLKEKSMPGSSQNARTIAATVPPLLVRRLDHWIIDQDPYMTRSFVIGRAIEEFLDRQDSSPGDSKDAGGASDPLS